MRGAVGYPEGVRRSAILLTATLALLGCESEASLVVDLRTDYVAGEEVSRVDLDVQGTPVSRNRALTVGDDLASGIRVAELTALEPGRRELTLTLVAPDGSAVATRQAILEVQRATAVTILVTRNCEGVVCDDPAAPACVDARCVPAECVAEDPDSCGEATSCDAVDCTPDVPCAEAECVNGFCVPQPLDERCATDEFCQSAEGCVPRTTSPDAGTHDAGAPDGGIMATDGGPIPLDAGGPDAGPIGTDAGVMQTCGDALEPNDTPELAADAPVASGFDTSAMHSELDLTTCAGDVDWIALDTLGVVRVRAEITTRGSGGAGMVCAELFTWSQLQRMVMTPPTGSTQICSSIGTPISLGPLTATIDGGANWVLLRLSHQSGASATYDVSFTGSLL